MPEAGSVASVWSRNFMSPFFSAADIVSVAVEKSATMVNLIEISPSALRKRSARRSTRAITESLAFTSLDLKNCHVQIDRDVALLVARKQGFRTFLGVLGRVGGMQWGIIGPARLQRQTGDSSPHFQRVKAASNFRFCGANPST